VPGDTNVILATINLKAINGGNATITIANPKIDSDRPNIDQGIITATIVSGSLSVPLSTGSITSSQIGIFRPSSGYWYFDYNLDGIVNKSFRYGGVGDKIIQGDWQGTGKDGIAIFRPSTGYWYFDYNLDGIVDKSFRYGGGTDQIIAGKWA